MLTMLYLKRWGLDMVTDLSGFQVYSNAISVTINGDFKKDNPMSFVGDTAMIAGGKRIRGILALLACEAISGSYHQAMPIAAAYESLHSAALVQDDIIDGSNTRRNEPSLVAREGVPRAILVSDILIFEVLRQLAKYHTESISKERLCDLAAVIYRSLTATVHGEMLDISLGRKATVRLDEYLEMVRCKTGALLAGSAKCGAIVGSGSAEQIEILADFGEKQGTAFQIIDDVLDIFGEQKVIRKPIFMDIKNRRVNVVVLHYLQNSDSLSERKFIETLFGKQRFSREDIDKAREILMSIGSADFAGSLACEIINQAKRRLKGLPESPAKSKLLNFEAYCWKDTVDMGLLPHFLASSTSS
jgi:geranylgeranyl pyrophosphate synthase